MNSNGLCFVFPIEIAMWGSTPLSPTETGKNNCRLLKLIAASQSRSESWVAAALDH